MIIQSGSILVNRDNLNKNKKMDQDGPDPPGQDQATAFPHQLQDTVTSDALAAHMAAHPEMYHPDLQEHIHAFLGDKATEEVVTVVPVDNAEVTTPPSPEVEASISGIETQHSKTENEKFLLAKKWLTDNKIGEDHYFAPVEDDAFLSMDIPKGMASDIALALLDTEEAGLVSRNINAFGKLDNRVAGALIKRGSGLVLLEGKAHFPDLIFDTNLALQMIEAGNIWTVFENLSLFEGFVPDTQLGQKLLMTDAGAVLEYRNLFPELTIDESTLAMLIETQQYSAVFSNLDVFPGLPLDQVLAEQMIEQGHGWTLLSELDKFTISDFDKLFDLVFADGNSNGYMLASNLDKFPEEMIPRSVTALIEAGYGQALLFGDNPMDRIKGVSQLDLFHMLVDAGEGGFAISRSSLFSELDVNEMLQYVVGAGHERDIADHLDTLSEVPPDIAYALAKAGFGYQVLRSLDKFTYIDMQTVAQSIVESGGVYLVLEWPERFNEIDMLEFANQAVDAGFGSIILTWRERVPDLVLDETFAKRLIRAGSAVALMDHYDSFLFDYVDIEILKDLIMSGHGAWGMRHQDFGGNRGEGGIDGLGREHAERLISDGEIKLVAANLHMFKEMSNEVFDALIEDGQGWRFGSSFELQMRRFPDLVLDSSLAIRLIDAGNVSTVLENAGAFIGFQLNAEVARRIAATDRGYELINHMESFAELSPNEFAEMLSTPANIGHVFANWRLFPDFRPGPAVAEMMLAQEKGDLRSLLVQNLGLFEGIDRIAIGKQLSDSDSWRLVVTYYNKFPGLRLGVELANKMTADPQAHVLLVHNLDNFEDIDRNKIAEQVITKGNGQLILENLAKFPDFVLGPDIAEQFLITNNASLLVENLDMFTGIDRADLAQKLFKRIYDSGVLLDNYEKFPDFNFDLAAAQEFTRWGHLGKVIYNINAFVGVDRKAIADILFNTGNGQLILSNPWAFSEIPRNAELAERLLNTLEQIQTTHGALVEALDTFDASVDRTHIAETLIALGTPDLVINNIEKFHDFRLTARHAQDIVNSGGGELVMIRSEAFELSRPERTALAAELESLFANGLFDTRLATENYLKFVSGLEPAERPGATSIALEALGTFVTPESIAIVSSILRGELPEGAAKIGIIETGERGVEQFKQILSAYSAQLRGIELSSEAVLQAVQSPILREILKMTSRFDSAQFGSHADDTLINLLRLQVDALYVTPMPEAYKPSGKVEVVRVANDKKTPVEWTEDVRNRYGVLASELSGVAWHIGDAGSTVLPTRLVIGQLTEELRTQIETVVGGFDVSLQNPDLPEKARQNIERQVRELRRLITPTSEKGNSYPLRSLANFESNFQTLGSHAALYPVMRKIMFAWALRSTGGQWVGSLQQLGTEPSIADVSIVNEYIDHIVNDQVFSNYFKDRKSLDLFKRIASVKALQEGFVRAQKGLTVSTKTTAMQFVPTRGIMMELSGHIADACWAEKQDSIARIMPNMTAVIMKKNPGDPKTESLVGAALLIETTNAQNGEPVLIIRGLNPLETTINSHDIGSFFENFVAYARSIAEARGMKLAIAIDDHAGGSATNRPAMFGYLSAIKPTLKKVVVPAADTTFNGYNITNDTYFL